MNATTTYMPLLIGLGLIALAYVAYRVGKTFNKKSYEETENKPLYLVWKLFWFLATVGWLTATVFAFLNIFPYIQQLLAAVVNSVYMFR